MSRILPVLWVTALLWSICSAGQEYPFVTVTKPGDPASLETLFQDSKGRIWVGGGSGAAVYDGAHFFSMRDFGMRDGPPADKEARAFAEDDEAGVWICSFGGIYRFKNGELRLLRTGACTSIARAAPGIMLATLNPDSKVVSTSTFLYRFRRNRDAWEAARIPGIVLANPTPSNVFVTVDHAGAALYPCAGGWCELSSDAIHDLGGTSDAVPTQVFHRFNFGGLLKVLHDRYGCLWFVTVSDGFEQCRNDSSPVKLPTDFTNINVQIQELPDGRMAIASEGGGIAIGRPGKYQFATPRNGLPDSQMVWVAQDGTIWIAGDQGLIRFVNPFRMEYWTSREGLSGGFAIARLGSQVFAGSGKDVVVLDPDRSRWSILPHARGSGTVMQLLPSPTRSLFAVVRHHPGTLIEIGPKGNILRELKSAASAERAVLAGDKQLWLASRGDVAVQKVRSAGDRLMGSSESLPNDGLQASDIESSGVDGSIWVCYEGGLAVRNASGWSLAASQKTGLVENDCAAMGIHPNGDIWYGYLNHPGFARIHFATPGDYAHPTIQNYASNSDEVGSATQFIGVDHRSWIWFGTAEGVFVATADEAERGRWLHLDDVDGLPSVSTNEGAFMVDSDGSVWFGVDSNIVHFNPRPDFVESIASPNVFISGFSWNGGAPRLADAVGSFQSGARITALVGSLQFDRRNALWLRYRVVPDEAAWKETRALDVRLGVLPAGQHRLEMQARLASGPWSPMVSHSFTVLKPVWLTWPALAGYLTFAAGGAGWTLRQRRKRRERASKVLPDLAEWRLAILSPEIQSLQGALLDERFEVGKVLARGGFATVAEGRDFKEGGRRCAVKIFRQEWADKEWMTKRFRQEVQALEQIHHPNVVSIYGHGATPSGAPYLVMEFILGTTLRDLTQKRGISRCETAIYLRQIGSALDEIHAHGVCHRDLKPENLMIRDGAAAGNEIVLIDFSIAIVKDPDETLHGLSRAAGTLHYMAPEQAIGYADSSTDIYSLAKIVIEMLTGERLSELLPDASIDLPERVRELLTAGSPELSSRSIERISRALEFHPLHRPSHAKDFANAIADDLEAAEKPKGSAN